MSRLTGSLPCQRWFRFKPDLGELIGSAGLVVSHAGAAWIPPECTPARIGLVEAIGAHNQR